MSETALRLICPGCSTTFGDARLQRCADCSRGLEVEYPDFTSRVSGWSWPPARSEPLARRYAPLLPAYAGDAPTLGEGATPLLPSPRLKAELGGCEVHLAVEGLNPTGSFKDRGTAVAMWHALATGARAVGAVSTGNMAASVAAYAARVGLPAVILVADTVPAEKLRATGVYGPLLLQVRRDHGQLYFDSLELGRELGIYFMNGDDPFRLEGQKTLVLDACARVHPAEPTHILVPLSSGGNFLAIAKGLRELGRAGLLARIPRLVGVQPAGCAPIHEAHVNELPEVRRVEHPDTIAGSIRNPYPPSGNGVLQVLRDTEASVVTVTDDEMIAAQRDLAHAEGIWAQPDSAASVAALRKLCGDGTIGASDHVVCVLTGAGHRDARTPPASSVAAEAIDFAALRDRLREFGAAAA